MPPVSSTASFRDKYGPACYPSTFPEYAKQKDTFTGDPSKPFSQTKYTKRKDSWQWQYTDEPHLTRRKHILQGMYIYEQDKNGEYIMNANGSYIKIKNDQQNDKNLQRYKQIEITKPHPEIRQLFGPEPLTFWIVLGITLTQLVIASFIGNASWTVFLLVMYCYGATVNHTLQLANHEISHNLCFQSIWANKLTGILANIVTCIPSSVTFRYYHMDHHQYQGYDIIDTDIPTQFEIDTFTNTPLKLIWVLFQSLAYGLRPIFMNPKPLQPEQILNAIIVILCDVLMYYYLGLWGFLYLLGGTFIGTGPHPAAGHFIAEHYAFVKGYETYSYYGCVNYVNFNVGYHYEHHDFPKIAWSKLSRVREIAPEWYDHLPHHESYCKVIWKYITDPEIGPWSRIKRGNEKKGKNNRKK